MSQINKNSEAVESENAKSSESEKVYNNPDKIQIHEVYNWC